MRLAWQFGTPVAELQRRISYNEMQYWIAYMGHEARRRTPPGQRQTTVRQGRAGALQLLRRFSRGGHKIQGMPTELADEVAGKKGRADG